MGNTKELLGQTAELTGDWLFLRISEILKILNTPLIELNDSKISISSVLVATAIFIVSLYVAKLGGRLVGNSLQSRGADSGVRDSLERFTRYAIIAGGLLFALDTLGFSIRSLTALGAVLMVGIGFGLQNITQNFIAGIILLVERPVKVGDIVRVGESTGKVTDIRVRATIIQTRDDVSIIVPNSKFISEDVINDSYSGENLRLKINIGVAYGSDVGKVKSLLLQVALQHPEVIKSPAPNVHFVNFGDSSLDFQLLFWTSNIWEKERISSDLRFAIDAAFRENQVQVPFPQRDIHIYKEGPLL